MGECFLWYWITRVVQDKSSNMAVVVVMLFSKNCMDMAIPGISNGELA